MKGHVEFQTNDANEREFKLVRQFHKNETFYVECDFPPFGGQCPAVNSMVDIKTAKVYINGDSVRLSSESGTVSEKQFNDSRNWCHKLCTHNKNFGK